MSCEAPLQINGFPHLKEHLGLFVRVGDYPLSRASISVKRYGFRSFQYAAPALWNNLPESIKSSKELSSLKSSLKTYLCNDVFC